MNVIFALLCSAFLLSPPVKAQDQANYFRAWQGFRAPELTSENFLAELDPFMRETVDLYQGRALNNYIVIIPPAERPDYLPEEFALVALSSKEDYQAIRATPEGQHYGARHWDVFDRARSKSADPMVDFSTAHLQKLEHNVSYDVVGTPIDWSQGHTQIYIGLRRGNVSKEVFLERMASHLALVKQAFHPRGLKGYIVIANENYEVAFLNWSSEKAMKEAAQSPAGLVIRQDADELLQHFMFAPAHPFVAGGAVKANQAYSTLAR